MSGVCGVFGYQTCSTVTTLRKRRAFKAVVLTGLNVTGYGKIVPGWVGAAMRFQMAFGYTHATTGYRLTHAVRGGLELMGFLLVIPDIIISLNRFSK